MIKTLAYFPSQTARNSTDVMSALLASAQGWGITTKADDKDCDAALIWSVLWNGRMAANQQIYQHYRNLGRPVIVVDVGCLHRGVTWKVAVDNINARGYYGHTENLDWDRPKKLGLTLGTISKVKPEIIIAAQHSRSLQVENLVSIEQWISNMISVIKQYTDRPIVIRPHPRSRLDAIRLPRVPLINPRKVTGTYDDFDFDVAYHAVINYNSGPGILSALHGTRTLVDETSLAYPVSISIQDIEKSYDLDRSRWFTEISHTEYTVEELAQGLWLKRLSEKLR